MKKKLTGKIVSICIVCLLTILLTACNAPGSKTEKAWEDGVYYVNISLEGGSGRATLQSPATLQVQEGKMTVTLIWSSPNYDYMMLGEEKYLSQAAPGENSCFTLPVESVPCTLEVTADTTAMSVPHEIEYTITITNEGKDFSALEWEEGLQLDYAEMFSVKQSGPYHLISIPESGEYLLLEKNAPVPTQLPENIVLLKKPLDRVYLVATSVMDMLQSIDKVDRIRLSGTKESDWFIPGAVTAMQSGEMLYAGKYNAPDYELILSEDCHLAIESTMIYHNPEVKEKLEELHIPVLVERSSYEPHPLGRMEWVKLYGLLFDAQEEAEQLFAQKVQLVDFTMTENGKRPTVAFFYVTANGSVNVRKKGDYISRMIDLAGGRYIFSGEDDEKNEGLSTMNMQMEDFFAAAADADFLIYNATIEGQLQSMDDLLALNPIFSQFKAVQSGQVYCTAGHFFQETMGTCDFIKDLHEMMEGTWRVEQPDHAAEQTHEAEQEFEAQQPHAEAQESSEGENREAAFGMKYLYQLQ